MRSLAVLYCLLGCWSIARAQDSCRLLLRITQQAHFATADPLGNTCLITADNATEKFDSTGRFVARYSNNRLGTAARIDASNPLKLMLWYDQFQTAVFLDRNLTELGRISFREKGYNAVTGICMAADGNLWVYDAFLFRLLKLRPNGDKMLESDPLNLQFPMDPDIIPSSMQEDGDRVWICFPEWGLLSFDIFAQNPVWEKSRPEMPIFGYDRQRAFAATPDGFQYWRPGYPGAVHKLLAPGTYWFAGGRVFVQRDKFVEMWAY